MFGGQDNDAGSAPAPHTDSSSGVPQVPTNSTLNGIDDILTSHHITSSPDDAAPTTTYIPTPHEPAHTQTHSTDDTPAPSPAAHTQDVNDSDLLNLKQDALQKLSPLLSHLQQSPEEKFRTTMMMIQASDNKDLLKDAYEAAQAIPDDKVKAQALLDVINEINYFTQQKPLD